MNIAKIQTGILAILLLICAASAQQPITVKDIFELKTVDSPRISPDGKWIAYTETVVDIDKDSSRTRIWKIPVEGGDPIPITGKDYSAGSPKWSPDGKYLTFLASKIKGEKTQVWGISRHGGEPNRLTQVKQGISDYEWSPDGKRILLTIRDPRPEDLLEGIEKEIASKPKPYVIDRLQFKRDFVGYLDRRRSHLYVYEPGSDKEPVQITSGDFEDSQPAWSPDGKSIAFVSNRTKEPDNNVNTDIWIVSADNQDKGKDLQRVTSNPREDTSPSWSPDGKNIVYRTVRAPLERLWYVVSDIAIVSRDGGDSEVITKGLDRNGFNPRYTDSNTILFMLEDDGAEQLASYDLRNQKLSRLTDRDTVVWEYDYAAGNTILLAGTPELPFEAFTLKDGKLKQVTFSNKKLLGELRLSKGERIEFNSKDGTRIGGFMYRPVGAVDGVRYPTILWIHGGPVGQYSSQFSSRAQLFAANGYNVLHINPRGSSGRGPDFSYAIYKDWGNVDYQDVVAGVDYAIKSGYADPEKLGVGGWSYGGVLTNYVITKTSRFKGAISGASMGLFRANYGHDQYQQLWEVEFGLPWENAELWEKLSPFNDVEKITTPTLWIGGQLDWNVPIMNSEQMYQAMKRLGRETQLVVYPGEHHHPLISPAFEKDRFERYLDWYGKYVKGVKANPAVK